MVFPRFHSADVLYRLTQVMARLLVERSREPLLVFGASSSAGSCEGEAIEGAWGQSVLYSIHQASTTAGRRAALRTLRSSSCSSLARPLNFDAEVARSRVRYIHPMRESRRTSRNALG
jgi:hypothetical protein